MRVRQEEHRAPLAAIWLTFAVVWLVPGAGTAATHTCGGDPVANTAAVLCAAPSGPCTGSDVVLGALVEVTAGGCTFDLEGRNLSVEATFEMVGSGYIRILDAGNVTIATNGKLKARGDFSSPGGIGPGGAVEIESSGSIDHYGVVDVTGDPGGTIDVTAAGAIRLHPGSVTRSKGDSSFADDGARFADGGIIALTSGANVVVDGDIFLKGQNAAAGGELRIEAATDIDILSAVDATGGEGDGGTVRLLAGGDVTIDHDLDVDSPIGGGCGGEIWIEAGDEGLGGQGATGAIMITSATMKLSGSSANGLGGDGGHFHASARGAITLTSTSTIRVNAGSGHDGSGGLIEIDTLAAGTAETPSATGDISLASLIKGGSGDAGGLGGELRVVSGADLTLSADTELKGKDGGGRVTLKARGTLSYSGVTTATASAASGAGGEMTAHACTLTVAASGDIATSGAGSGGIVLGAGGTLTVSATSSVDAGDDGTVELVVPSLFGACDNDPEIQCAANVDCTVGCETGTCTGLALNTGGTQDQFNPAPLVRGDPALAVCP